MGLAFPTKPMPFPDGNSPAGPAFFKGARGGSHFATETAKRLRPAVEEIAMLRWALVFLVIALIAGVLGFGGVYGASMDIAKILFFVFLVLFAISAVMHLVRGRGTP